MDDTRKSSCSCPPRVGPISWILQLNVFLLLLVDAGFQNTEIPNTRHYINACSVSRSCVEDWHLRLCIISCVSYQLEVSWF